MWTEVGVNEPVDIGVNTNKWEEVIEYPDFDIDEFHAYWSHRAWINILLKIEREEYMMYSNY